MTDQSMLDYNGASESRFVKKAFGKHQRRRQKCNKKRRAAKPKTKFELMSNEILHASSEKMLKRLLKDHRKPIRLLPHAGREIDRSCKGYGAPYKIIVKIDRSHLFKCTERPL